MQGKLISQFIATPSQINFVRQDCLFQTGLIIPDEMASAMIERRFEDKMNFHEWAVFSGACYNEYRSKGTWFETINPKASL